MINNLPPLRVITLNKIPVYIRDVSDIEINSSLHILTEVEEIRLADFKCLKRKKTFLGVRTIVKELFPNFLKFQRKQKIDEESSLNILIG